MDYVDWNRGLLLGSLLIVIAAMSLVTGRSPRDRLLAVGIVTQGIAMLFVMAGDFFPRNEFELAALGMLGLFCLWSGWKSVTDWLDRSPKGDS